MGIIFRIVNVIGENVCMAMQKFVKICEICENLSKFLWFTLSLTLSATGPIVVARNFQTSFLYQQNNNRNEQMDFERLVLKMVSHGAINDMIQTP